MEKEIWKDVVGHEGLYQVSNLGRVKSLPRNGTILTEKIIKPHLLKSGYLQVELSKNNKMHGYRVHRLVAESFVLNPEQKECVNHIDGDKTNNKVENLEWVTRSENQLHAIYAIKTQKTRPVVQRDKNGRFIKRWDCIATASRALGIRGDSIVRNCRGRRKSTGGFIWSYN